MWVFQANVLDQHKGGWVKEMDTDHVTSPHPLSHWWPSEEMVTGADSLASISHRLGEARGNNRWQSQSTDGEDSWNIGISVGPNSKFGPNTEYRICSGFENGPNTNNE